MTPKKSHSLIARSGRDLLLDLARRTKTETVAQRHILLYYASWARDDGSFSVGLEQTHEETGYSPKTITRANADFKAAGIMDWTKGHGNRSTKIGVVNLYQFRLSVFRTRPYIAISSRQPTADEREVKKEIKKAASLKAHTNFRRRHL